MKDKDRLFLEAVENTIGYKFKNKNYLQTALTHSSYVNEHKSTKDNERLEFLGDSVLGLIVSNISSLARAKKSQVEQRGRRYLQML